MAARERYRGFIADSARWDDFPFRRGDVVISTPSKSGTTWMQMLVALLVLDGPDLPGPLSVLSPWVDMHLTPLDELRDRLAAQEHRRFLKTHVPLDGLPHDDRVTYLVVGRDPRDVWASMEHHADNLRRDQLAERRVATAGAPAAGEVDDVDWPEDRADWFRFQLGLPRGRDHTEAHVAHVLHHLRTGWDRRDAPNVVLAHYTDLAADLPGELTRLAAAIGIPLAPGRADQLAAAASLDAMRARADRMAPESDHGVWRDPTAFFRSGRVGEWRTRFSPGDLAAYEARVDELAGDAPDFLAWAHGGRRGGDWRLRG